MDLNVGGQLLRNLFRFSLLFQTKITPQNLILFEYFVQFDLNVTHSKFRKTLKVRLDPVTDCNQFRGNYKALLSVNFIEHGHFEGHFLDCVGK